jgi:hypothetical protein
VAGECGDGDAVHRARKSLGGENGYCESFNGMLRDECLNGEIFYSLKEAQIVIERWIADKSLESNSTAIFFFILFRHSRRSPVNGRDLNLPRAHSSVGRE